MIKYFKLIWNFMIMLPYDLIMGNVKYLKYQYKGKPFLKRMGHTDEELYNRATYKDFFSPSWYVYVPVEFKIDHTVINKWLDDHKKYNYEKYRQDMNKFTSSPGDVYIEYKN